MTTNPTKSDPHVVLGAGGAAGSALVRELTRRGHTVVAAGPREPADLPHGARFVAVDATDPHSVTRAALGAGHVYMAAQPAYTRWATDFPPMLDAVVQGVSRTNARLVMVDNLYTYGPVVGPLTEDSPQSPQSAKGRVRLAMTERLLAAHNAGDVRVVIGRGSDYYGPGVVGSMVGAAFFDAVLAGKRPQVIGRADQPHSFTFIDDFARALALLGEREDAYGRVWHVPTSEPLTVTALAELIAGEAGTKARAPAVLSGLPLRLVSKVVPIVAALADVQYQTTAPFVTDGSRFARAFGFTPTEHREAVRQTIRWLRARTDVTPAARRRATT